MTYRLYGVGPAIICASYKIQMNVNVQTIIRETLQGLFEQLTHIISFSMFTLCSTLYALDI